MAITRSPRPSPDTGVTDAGQLAWIENIVEGLAFDTMRRESVIDRIANTDVMAPLEKFGQSITFRVLYPVDVKAYVMNQDLVPDTVSGTSFSLTVDHAYYAFPTLDPIDMKQINLPLMNQIAKNLAEAHKENEMNVILPAILTTVYAATAMDYHGQVPGTVCYQPDTPSVAASKDRTDDSYIIKQFISARKAVKQKLGSFPKGMYAVVNSDVEEILLNCDQSTFQVSGESNRKAIEDGDFGMKVAGFDLIFTDAISTATYDNQTDICQGFIGHKRGLGFVRQLMETDINFKMWTKFSRGCRQLDVFGHGLSDSRYFGALPIKVN
jgi:hypothetical protein